MGVNGRAEIVNRLCTELRNFLTNTMHNVSGRELAEPACVYSFPKKVNTAVNITITQNYGACSLC
jgi:hypothetical protein